MSDFTTVLSNKQNHKNFIAPVTDRRLGWLQANRDKAASVTSQVYEVQP